LRSNRRFNSSSDARAAERVIYPGCRSGRTEFTLRVRRLQQSKQIRAE
jgi:hypothetical protein